MTKYGIERIVGKTVKEVAYVDDSRNGDTIIMSFTDGSKAKMYHSQDCCENVSLEEYSISELRALEGQTILEAREDSEETEDGEWGGIQGWTFYNIQGSRSFANLRWYGSSNGYYSIGVTVEVDDD